MLAAVFVINGAKAIRNPDALAARAKPFADQVVPPLKRFAPAPIADRVPDDARTLVRINGAIQLLGGLALATGKGRRTAALTLAATMVPATLAGHAWWEEDDPAQRTIHQAHFLKNVGLTGGLLLAAVDTEGKPGLAWRARHGASDARHASTWVRRAARREARIAARTAKREARMAARTARLEAKLVAATSPPARVARAAKRQARLGSKAAKATAKTARTTARSVKPVLDKVHPHH